MTPAPAAELRPGWQRLAAIVVLGPLVGALALGGLSLLFPGSEGAVGRVLTLILVGYGLGLIPASLAAGIYALLYPLLVHLSSGWLLLACIAIGGLCGAISVGISLVASGHSMVLAPALIGAGAAAGAAALAATALPYHGRRS